ncbi:GINS complex, Sld5 component [Ascodesmis nigricans]|uniref:DNA replication complex GINS protein SLD5 n=1 Tax=Ascodesmis nigricans TaxID=341454 RepID=A0A4S2N8C0_9PEZI|nr:GINS complex, Sld5 component [Ascodesmis nigricans]
MDDILAEFDAGAPSSSSPQDVEHLTKFWIAERTAPEILPYQGDVLERLMERVRDQISLLESSLGNLDPTSSFRLILVQTELERIKFLIRAYLRCRLHKIDKYSLHILQTPEVRARLAPNELGYMKSHLALMNNHYLASFLKNFPENLRRLDDTVGRLSMVDEPDMDSAVFCKVNRDVDTEITIRGTDAAFELKRGEVLVVRYSAIRELVGNGDVELI